MRHQLPLTLLFTAACMNGGTTDESATVTSDLDKSDGGFTTADEAPMFGDEAQLDAEAIEPDTQVADTMTTDPTVTALDASTTADGRDVIVVWGRIPGDPLATESRDWSGQIQVSRGALIVRRTIAFEDRTDGLLPRTAVDTVAFTSKTRPFVDGLALRVLDPTVDPAATPMTLTYTSSVDGTQYMFDLAQLAAGPVVIDAGDGFKMVAIAQHRHDNDGCVGGFMRGRWRALTPNAGVYLGIVTNRLGERIGHVRGIYGHRRSDGEPVMYGKFIDLQGHFLGVIAGTYGNGDFLARWKELGDDDHGRVRGHYFEGATVGAGNFVARWAQTDCSEDPAPTGP